ncbi:MAG: Ig-like domain-containing protein, partial [Cystobacter sp.]
MKHAPPALTRLVAWSVLLLGVSLGASACRDPAPPPPGSERPSAERSTVQVNPARGARANGQDLVEILVTVRDSRGNGLAGHTVTVEATGEGNTLTQASGPSDEQGVAIATLVSTVVGTKTVTAKVSSEGGDVTLGSKPTVDFGPVEAVAKLAFTTEPVSGTAGVALAAFEVTLQDAAGVKVASASDTVTVALSQGSAQAELKGTLSVAAVNGVARFTTVSLEKAGTGYTLVASAAGMAPATSASFDIVPAAAKTLAFTKQPSTRGTGQAFAVDVTLTDAFGNPTPVTAPQVALTVNKGTLVGTTTVAPVAGVASFSGLSITEVGSGYVLTAAAEGLTSATSTAFDITAEPVDACVGKVCEPAAPTCAADGVSRTTYTAACVDEQGSAVCKQ